MREIQKLKNSILGKVSEFLNSDCQRKQKKNKNKKNFKADNFLLRLTALTFNKSLTTKLKLVAALPG